MEKIIKALLQAKFPGINVDVLMEVVQATPNPAIATELLCGLYEEVLVNKLPKDNYRKDEANIKFLSFNKFTSKVNYSYQDREAKTSWVLNGEAIPAIADITPSLAHCYASECAKAAGIEEKQFRETHTQQISLGIIKTSVREGICDLNYWQ